MRISIGLCLNDEAQIWAHVCVLSASYSGRFGMDLAVRMRSQLICMINSANWRYHKRTRILHSIWPLLTHFEAFGRPHPWPFVAPTPETGAYTRVGCRFEERPHACDKWIIHLSPLKAGDTVGYVNSLHIKTERQLKPKVVRFEIRYIWLYTIHGKRWTENATVQH